MAIPRRDIPAKIEARKAFKGSNICGEIIDPGRTFYGRLSDEWAQKLRSDAPTYVVLSYGTPIAWVAANGTPVVPDAKYSVTTSAHQSLAAIGLLGTRTARSHLV